MAKIAIDAGHGINVIGKRCLKSLDKAQTREWVLNDRVSDALAIYLKSAGHEVMRVDDTDGSTNVSLTKRVNTANNWPADFYVSIHHNAGINGGKGGGTVVYVYKGCSEKSKEAQKAIYKNAIARADLKGNRSNGMPTGNLYVTKYTKMPSCLVECGFMDSSTDIKYILNPSWSKKIALGIAEGICEVFGGKVNEKAEDASGKFMVKVNTDLLNIRKGVGVSYPKVGKITDKGIYTIVETKKANNGVEWGKLKSGAGWICLSPVYVKKL